MHQSFTLVTVSAQRTNTRVLDTHVRGFNGVLNDHFLHYLRYTESNRFMIANWKRWRETAMFYFRNFCKSDEKTNRTSVRILCFW